MTYQVEVLPYSVQWVELFLQEQSRLSLLAPDLILEIHHIGSTSVPGLAAKPIIDILMVASDIMAVGYQTKAFLS